MSYVKDTLTLLSQRPSRFNSASLLLQAQGTSVFYMSLQAHAFIHVSIHYVCMLHMHCYVYVSVRSHHVLLYRAKYANVCCHSSCSMRRRRPWSVLTPFARPPPPPWPPPPLPLTARRKLEASFSHSCHRFSRCLKRYLIAYAATPRYLHHRRVRVRVRVRVRRLRRLGVAVADLLVPRLPLIIPL